MSNVKITYNGKDSEPINGIDSINVTVDFMAEDCLCYEECEAIADSINEAIGEAIEGALMQNTDTCEDRITKHIVEWADQFDVKKSAKSNLAIRTLQDAANWADDKRKQALDSVLTDMAKDLKEELSKNCSCETESAEPDWLQFADELSEIVEDGDKAIEIAQWLRENYNITMK